MAFKYTWARFHHCFRSPVSGTGIGTGTVMVSKSEQVQEQEWVRNAKRSVTGTVKGTWSDTGTGSATGIVWGWNNL